MSPYANKEKQKAYMRDYARKKRVQFKKLLEAYENRRKEWK